ncbi:dihydrodipicolinate synthase [Kiloniella litopenaei]|uniref:Dihydrodipicolinate synthase n=1 Tax=Kiloniella litopenaei TaxID=1549748 RepID=A0A0M2RF86_9PROT|nr:dihydrodipicolinate synthase family protein [Kiloniella litopenaei]KKJ78665.1 dihydrodipicolinate synthase [Kiloniella litopenaei]
MWKGVIPAVTTKFDENDNLDHTEMKRCFDYQMDAGCDGLIVAGSLGEGSMLSKEEKIAVLKTAKAATGDKPAIMTINEAATRDACAMAQASQEAGADGIMLVPSPIYHTDPRETVASMRQVAEASDLPIMIYSNRVAYRVDVTPEIMEELADEKRFVAIKESSDDIRRTTEIINKFGDRFDVFTGVDNLGYEALSVGAIGWVAGLVVAFPKETVAIYRLMQAGRNQEALEIYRWFRPLLDLDVSTYLVQNIKLAEQIEIGSNDRCRMPRMPLIGAQRERAEKIIRDAIACRPELPVLG